MYLIVLFFLLFSLNSGLAANKNDFLFKGKEIHPLCIQKFITIEWMRNRRLEKNLEGLGSFYKPSKENSEISLKECHYLNKKFNIEGDGSVSYSPNPKSRETIDYKVILKIKENVFLLKTLWNGGGSGYFSNLMIFKLEKNLLHLVSEGSGLGGDRCNGGFSIEDEKENSFVVSKNLTPPDLIEYSKLGKKLKLKAYEDLEASAMSCVAMKKTVVEVKNNKLTSKLLGFEITGTGDKSESWVKEYKYQKCFNTEIESLIKSINGKLALQSDLDKFIKKFKANCIEI